MSATRVGTAAYRARLMNKMTIMQLAATGYGAVSTIIAGVELASTAGTAAAAGGGVAASGWTIWTLPIAAFALGASIRQGWDDKEDKRRQARMIIIGAAQGEAVENHGRRYRNSKILDPSSHSGIAELPGPKYFMVGKHFETFYRKWAKQLDDDLALWESIEEGSSGAAIMRMTGKHETWQQFVTSRFEKMTREYGNILVMAENVSSRV